MSDITEDFLISNGFIKTLNSYRKEIFLPFTGSRWMDAYNVGKGWKLCYMVNGYAATDSLSTIEDYIKLCEVLAVEVVK